MERTTQVQPPPTDHRSADAFIRRVLLIPDGCVPPSDSEVERVFTASLALSALRCVFTYMVFPLVVPAVGAFAGFGPVIGACLSGLALVFDVRAIRAFWLASDPRRWMMTWLYLAVIAFVLYLLAIDIGRAHP
ncbi:MAG: hypothetical protein ACREN1_03260 [Candidatus Dormibacteria bacterium]